MKTICLSYDPNSHAISATQLQTFIAHNRMIASWYRPYDGTYYFKTNEHLHILRGSFDGMLGGTPYLLNKIDATSATGSLSQSIWEWIYSDDDGFLALIREMEGPEKLAT